MFSVLIVISFYCDGSSHLFVIVGCCCILRVEVALCYSRSCVWFFVLMCCSLFAVDLCYGLLFVVLVARRFVFAFGMVCLFVAASLFLLLLRFALVIV